MLSAVRKNGRMVSPEIAASSSTKAEKSMAVIPALVRPLGGRTLPKGPPLAVLVDHLMCWPRYWNCLLFLNQQHMGGKDRSAPLAFCALRWHIAAVR